MLPRTLEPEVMDSAEEAGDYDAMDHGAVNRAFVADLQEGWDRRDAAIDHLKQAAPIFAEIGAREGGLQPEIWKLTEW